MSLLLSRIPSLWRPPPGRREPRYGTFGDKAYTSVDQSASLPTVLFFVSQGKQVLYSFIEDFAVRQQTRRYSVFFQLMKQSSVFAVITTVVASFSLSAQTSVPV